MNYPGVFESEDHWRAFEAFGLYTVGMNVSLIDGFIERVERDITTIPVWPRLPQTLQYLIYQCLVVEYTDKSVWINGLPENIEHLLRNLK